MAHRIAPLLAAVAGVALHGVNHPILHLLYDAYVVGEAVLRPRGASAVPVEEDDVTGAGLIAGILPQPPLLEPLNGSLRAGKLGDYTGVDVTALVGAPADKAGAPFHPAVEAVPAPVGLTAHIPDLRQRHRDNLAVTSPEAIENGSPHTAVFLRQQLRELPPLVGGEAQFIGHLTGSFAADGDR